MSAARGLAADEVRVTPAGARLSCDRLLTALSLFGLVLMTVGLRLIPTVVQPSLNWGDEIFQTIEPAHRLVYGDGLITWEFQLGLRSWLMPGLTAGLIEIARLFGDGPQFYLPTIAAGLGLIAAAPIVCAYLWCRESGLAAALVAGTAVAVAPELVYFGARALNEVVAAHILIIALYLTAPGFRVGARRHAAAGFLLGIVCLLRLQLAPAALLVALWPMRGEWGSRTTALIAGGAMALLAGAAFDWLTLGYPLASLWRNLYYNLYLGISSGFSVEPWYFYLAGELGIWLAAAPVILLLVVLGARRIPLLLAIAVMIVAVHSAIPHKEYRFVYPAILLLMVLAAAGLAQLTAAASQRWRRWEMRPGLVAWLTAAALTAAWSGISFAAWSHGALALLRQRAHDELLAMAYVRDVPGLCGVGLYGKNAWVRYGGYTWLHRPVPLFWPATQAELVATAPGFDALLYDRREREPPASLGFRTQRCFGPICVAEHGGGCVTLPAPSMWFPPELRGMRPPGGFGARPK
jgi:GPI mannosyltransferase 3